MQVYILAATFHQCQVSHSRSYLECQYNWWSTNKEKRQSRKYAIYAGFSETAGAKNQEIRGVLLETTISHNVYPQ